MASLGLNIARDGSIPVETIRHLNVTWVRIVAMPDHDLSHYFMDLASRGIRILLVFARESGGDYLSYRTRYGNLVHAIQVGNEPDQDGLSSWTMTQAELVSLGKSVRSIFPRPFPLVVAGLASGHPEWLDGVDLSWADVLSFHPYLRDAPNERDIEDLPDIDVLARDYARFGLPMIVTEWGWWGADEARAVEEVDDMTRWAGATSTICSLFYFCAADSMVPPFGLLEASGAIKPRGTTFRDRAQYAVEVPWLPPVIPPSGPDPWQFWTAETLAAAVQAPLSVVREHWPKLAAQQALTGVVDRLSWISMAGTVSCESGSWMPIREANYLGEPEPAESYRKTLRYYPYYGRGFIQITWKDTYASIGHEIAKLWGAGADDPTFDLVANPDNLLDADMSAAAAAIFFRDKAGGALAAAARAGNYGEVRRLVYGGYDPAGIAKMGRIAAALQASVIIPPVQTDHEVALAYGLALKTLRDTTLPALQAQLDEAKRIVIQMVGQS
jgi:hypothetical protein